MKKLLECLSTSERARKAYAQRLQVTAALVLYRLIFNGIYDYFI